MTGFFPEAVNAEMKNFLIKHGSLGSAATYQHTQGREIIIFQHPLTRQAIQTLARFLQNCPAVVKLNLHGTGVDDDGLIALIDALIEGKQKLASFNLQDNHITDRGLLYLADFWPKCPSLVNIVLFENKHLTIKGREYIQRYIPSTLHEAGLLLKIDEPPSEEEMSLIVYMDNMNSPASHRHHHDHPLRRRLLHEAVRAEVSDGCCCCSIL